MIPGKKLLNDLIKSFIPTGAFNMCCPRDYVSRHNGGTSGAPLKPLRVDNALTLLRRFVTSWNIFSKLTLHSNQSN